MPQCGEEANLLGLFHSTAVAFLSLFLTLKTSAVSLAVLLGGADISHTASLAPTAHFLLSCQLNAASKAEVKLILYKMDPEETAN